MPHGSSSSLIETLTPLQPNVPYSCDRYLFRPSSAHWGPQAPETARRELYLQTNWSSGLNDVF